MNAQSAIWIDSFYPPQAEKRESRGIESLWQGGVEGQRPSAVSSLISPGRNRRT